MGLDGGTIPTRGELVKMKEKPEQKDKATDLIHKWTNCTLTQLPLEQPILTCHLGMLFNKQSVLEYLLGRIPNKDNAFKHIESMKDTKVLKLTTNPTPTTDMDKYICPLTGVAMNGRQRFLCLWNCGCVISERALSRVKLESCFKCGEPFRKTDIVILNPNEDDLVVMRERMIVRKSQKRSSTSNSNPKSDEVLHHHDIMPSTSQISVSQKEDNSAKHSHPKKHKSLHKRKHSDWEKDAKSPKYKKHKKEKKHKKAHNDSKDVDKPRLHPGWNKYLASL